MAAAEIENISRNVRFPQMVYHCNPHDTGKCNTELTISLLHFPVS